MSASTAPLPAPAEGRDALSVLHSVFGRAFAGRRAKSSGTSPAAAIAWC